MLKYQKKNKTDRCVKYYKKKKSFANKLFEERFMYSNIIHGIKSITKEKKK